MSTLKPLCIILSAIGMAPFALAAEPVQKIKPPVAHAWIDLATFSGNMPAMPTAGGAAGMLGAMFGGAKGGGAKGNVFGHTQSGMTGRWMDVTVETKANPGLMSADEATAAPAKFATPLKLVAPQETKPEPATPTYNPMDKNPEMPKGKMYLYWGCSAEVRKGQPLVLDMSKMNQADMAKFFQTRGVHTPMPHARPGRPAWPNSTDDRMLPPGASLVGEHAFTGQGIPESMRVSIDAAHDLMPAIDVKRNDEGNAVLFKWQGMEQARGWFISSMGARPNNNDKGEMEMVFWTSSELPDMGSGLVNYQPNGSVDKWLKEKVILPARTTECMAPKEAVGPASMTRMIAYGEELNLVHPPRPKDPKVTWEQEWSAKVRLKSVATLMPGMGSMAAQQGTPAEAVGKEVKKSAVEGAATEIFKGLFGR